VQRRAINGLGKLFRVKVEKLAGEMREMGSPVVSGSALFFMAQSFLVFVFARRKKANGHTTGVNIFFEDEGKSVWR
jgi:hypothetical protein